MIPRMGNSEWRVGLNCYNEPMKNKVLAGFGIGTYVLSVLSSAEDLQGDPIMPFALIAISGLATVAFVIMATVRLWEGARGLAITFVTSAAILFASAVIQEISSSYGTPLIFFLNIVKVVNFIALILVIVKLFKRPSSNPTPKQ